MGKIMEMGDGRNFGSVMHLWVFCAVGSPAKFLFLKNGCLDYGAFFEVLMKSLKGEISITESSKYKDR